MDEIKTLELLIALLLFLPVIRPFSKDLRPLDGLVWLPPLSLACTICLFPAYGFRPEVIPLLVLGIILNIRNVPALYALIKRTYQDHFSYLILGHTFVTIFLLIISLGIAFYFAPLIDTSLQLEGVRAIDLRDEARGADLFLRIYGMDEPSPRRSPGTRPLMILLPPVMGSVAAVDQVCAELGTQGFTVLTYSRQKSNAPALSERKPRYDSPLGDKFRFLRALMGGTGFERANALGRALEEERKQDILFLLAALKQERGGGPLSGLMDRETLFLAGYGPGGSALALIGESPEFLTRYPEVKGLIAVDSPLWSMYYVEKPPVIDPPEEAGQWFKSLWSSISKGIIGLFPKKIPGIAWVPRPALPMLFIASARDADPRYRDGEEKPLIRILQTAPYGALATGERASFLDYSDYPAKYPLYGALFSGITGGLWEKEACSAGTASLMSAFAALVMAPDPQDPVKPPPLFTPQKRLLENIRFETSGVWNLPDLGYILSP